ncbi:hypothetical protein U473_11050 [Tepidibacillus decaturensis]|uniref:Pilus assembly protein n=2 Tax=Bacillaceae TaxID=186817 RepID=A0A135L7V5_9BACI|nr:hypothetical protein U473_11050 [Tepidibacillus decaturensis]
MKLWVKQHHVKRNIKEALQNEKGQGMVEYGLIIALIAVVVIVALTTMGGNLKDLFNKVAGDVSSTSGGTTAP